MATQTSFDQAQAVPMASVSGARFKALHPALARALFARVEGAPRQEWGRAEARGAFEDRTDLIGACALAEVSETTYRVHVAVVPERRRLGIGAELLHLAVLDLARRGARVLLGSHAADALDARRLVATLDVRSARRVRHGWADVAVLLSPPTTQTEEATR